MELGHGSGVLGQHFAVASLERLNEVIRSFLVLFLISSNFMVFPFLPFPACFVLHKDGSGTKQAGTVKGNERSPEGGWQGVSEGAVRAKRGWVGLARNRRGRKRPGNLKDIACNSECCDCEGTSTSSFADSGAIKQPQMKKTYYHRNRGVHGLVPRSMRFPSFRLTSSRKSMTL
jgi:hypothetical protein